jgi:hypothetical protein
VFPSLAAGVYDLSAEVSGFKTVVKTGIALDSASRRVVDIRLEVGEVTERIAVVAEAEQVQTTTGDIGRVITEQQITQLALNGRNYLQLIRMIPGVTIVNTNPFAMQLNTNHQAINGLRGTGSSTSLYVTLDGADNIYNGGNGIALVSPSVDSIAEVKVLTSSYSAEFGGRMGAIVNVVTKGGTREFHGTLFEFVRNDAFDARNFFAATVDRLRFNNFGGTLGGPVFIPGRWNTDRQKLFFFYSQEFKYTRQGFTQVNVVPSAAERSGDFRGSALPAPVDPNNGQPFPDRVVPRSRFSQNGPRLLQPLPLPNFAGPGGNHVISNVNQTDPRQELLRVDYNASDRTQITYRYTHDDYWIWNASQGTTLGFVPGGRPRRGYVTLISLHHTFSPTMLNFLSFNMGRGKIAGLPDNQPVSRTALGLTFPEIFPANRSNVGPQVSMAGFTGYNSGDRLTSRNLTFQIRDDFTKVYGRHTLKFGAHLTRSYMRENLNLRDEGVVSFNTSARNTSRNVIADVLLGWFQNYTEAERDMMWYSRFNQFEFYAQDSFRVNRRLTLDLGLRYNFIPPFYNPQGNVATFLPSRYDPAKAPTVSPSDGSIVPGTGDPYNGIAILGSGWPDFAKGRIPQVNDPALTRLFAGLPLSGSETNYRDWAPRIGVAWDIFGTGRTALRTGYGIFHERQQQNLIISLSSNPPFVGSANIFDGNIDNPAGGSSRLFPGNVTWWPQYFPTPRVMSYNFGIQQRLWGDVILDVNYVGNQARYLPRSLNANQLPEGTRLNPPNSTINPNALRQYRGYANVSRRDNGDNSNYNAFQMTVSRRSRSGLSLSGNYTWGKALDTSSGTPQNARDARPDYGLSSVHRAHIANFNYIWELPFFPRQSSPRLLHWTFGGWEISGVTSMQSGAPFTVTVPVDIARIGEASSRATVIGKANLPSGSRTPAQWFNTKAFLPPERMEPGRFGNAGRNIVIGPGLHTWDLSLMKFIPVSERVRFQFRAEAFNVFNHPSFTSINTVVRFNAAGEPIQNYGAVTAAAPARILSLGLKVMF